MSSLFLVADSEETLFGFLIFCLVVLVILPNALECMDKVAMECIASSTHGSPFSVSIMFNPEACALLFVPEDPAATDDISQKQTGCPRS